MDPLVIFKKNMESVLANTATTMGFHKVIIPLYMF